MTDHPILFIPGPTEVDAELRQILAMPLIGHRDKRFVAEVQAVCAKLETLFLTAGAAQGGATLFENAPATALMEAGIRNLVPRGARVLHLVCGAFSERWAKISKACGRAAETITVPWGESVTPAALRHALTTAPQPFAAVCITHCETSTSVLAPLQQLAETVREHAPDTLVLCDTVTSLAGAELQFDAWGLDLAFAGTQKCLALPPGLVVYAVSPRAVERAATVDERGFLLDFLAARAGLAEGKTLATPNVPLVYALSAQLDRIATEGLPARWRRHLAMQQRTLAFAADHGMVPLAPEGCRSPTVTALRAPGHDIAELAARARTAGFAFDQGYGKLKGEAFRIGHMGDHTESRLQRLLDALVA
ncbi:MAG: alanine--glyoxylate aminotransferase family protein [Planctomycetes bacterium]|nr:alanine--glyoxylate aminotransferase family protein [Planctomycetota bacterium]